jgi:hypothetical protein
MAQIFAPITFGSTRSIGEGRGFRLLETAHRGNTRLASHEHEDVSLDVVTFGVLEERVGRRVFCRRRGSLLIKPAGAMHANNYGPRDTRGLLLQLPVTSTLLSDHGGSLGGDARHVADVNASLPVAADSPAAARALVASQKQAGYDMLKVYQRLKPDVFDALVAAAREQHIAVVGHVPDQVGLERALRAGQVLVAHGVFFGVAVLDSAERYDLRKLPALVALARQRGVAVTPNIDAEFARLAVSEGRLDSIMSSPETMYLARPVESGWRAQTPEGVLRFAFPPKPAADFLMTLTKALADSGVLIVLGTDYPAIPGLFPGLGVGDELSNFVRAGLTPFQALSAATRNPGVFVARHIAESERFGEVREGYRADFVLLRANPLVDVANTRRPNGVMVRGRWMPTEAITQLRQALTAQFR